MERGAALEEALAVDETAALIQIRSQMGSLPNTTTLWEIVSNKLKELGYHRSALKWEEMFKNVHDYYQRTEEDGRQDEKGSSLDPFPTILSPAPMTPPTSQSQAQVAFQPAHLAVSLERNSGVNFLSDSAASSEGEEEMETGTVDTQPHSRKRKKAHDSDQRMTDFFNDLMKQVMQKQAAMHQKFLETIDKREQNRMIREENWKRQELAKLERQRELIAQERIVSASRDAAIVNFLERITGQTIPLPAFTHPNNPLTQPSVPQNHQHMRNQQEMTPRSLKQPQKIKFIRARQPSNTSEVVSLVPEKQTVPNLELSGGCSLKGTSAKWHKPGILALIQLRSGMESKFQEKGALKRLLWEEIAGGMQRMGYDKSAMKCKEKWENINKYYKKVKESEKKRPEEARTCPYYHELDSLYQKNVFGSTGRDNTGSVASGSRLPVDKDAVWKHDIHTSNVEANQPEDSVRKQLQLSNGTTCNLRPSNNVDDSGSCDLNREDDAFNYEKAEESDKCDDDDTEEEMKPVSKIQFRTQKVGSCNGGGQAPNSVLAIFQ